MMPTAPRLFGLPADVVGEHVPIVEVLADTLADALVARVEPDSTVLAALGAKVGGRLPTTRVPETGPAPLVPLTGQAVQDHLAANENLVRQHGVRPSAADCERVAELLCERILTRHAEMVAQAATGRVRLREEAAMEADRARRRAELLGQLAELDEKPGQRRGWFGQ